LATKITKTHGTVLNSLRITFDLSEHGGARVSMKGYVGDILHSFAITGGAKTPASV
jgi:hypothetical protein